MARDTFFDKFIAPARPILQRLEASGHEAYLVGGCVREAVRAEMCETASQQNTGTAEDAARCGSACGEKTGTMVGGAGEAKSPTVDIAEPFAPQSTDIDITTNALPEEVCRIFADLPVIETGLQHGTVTVLLPADATSSEAADARSPEKIALYDAGEAKPPALEVCGSESCMSEEMGAAARPIPVEITTYRVDGGYSDGRHPDQVRFVASLTEDLRRRDFTVNAMAMDQRGRLVDPFDGQKDLAAGIIRAVGDADTRFQEDGLRILRALRFAAVLTTDVLRGPGEPSASIEASAATVGVLDSSTEESGCSVEASACRTRASMQCSTGFRIDPETEAALFRCAHLLENISAERIFTELKKLLCGPAAGDVIRRYVEILAVVIPELGAMKGFAQNNPYHKYDVLEHCIRAMEAVRPVAAEMATVGIKPVEKATVQPALVEASKAEVKHRGQANVPHMVSDAPGSGGPVPADLATMKLAALLHDVGKPGTYTQDEKGIGHFYGHPQAGAKIARRILHRLKADRATTDRITHLIHYHDLVFQEDDRLLKRWMNRHTPQVLLEILAIKRADNIATGNATPQLLEKFDRIEAQIRRILRESREGKACFRIKDLAISGRDILALGIPEGPRIGQLLEQLLEAVIDGDLPNERETLLKYVQQRRNH